MSLCKESPKITTAEQTNKHLLRTLKADEPVNVKTSNTLVKLFEGLEPTDSDDNILAEEVDSTETKGSALGSRGGRGQPIKSAPVKGQIGKDM